jgi:pimeloyl-ACP methyl ester carboxylesterase
VYAMDRRGRGGSGDASEYELRREAEDIAVIVDSIGEPVNIIGHSYGALCAIESSLITENLNKMILYEGVPLNGADLYRSGVVDRLDALLESGDTEGILTTLFQDIVEIPPEEIEMMRSQQDAWAVRLANAHTLPRELRTETGYRFEPGRFKNMQTPTLLLAGSDSPARELENANGVAGALPDARVAILPGQQHAAMYAAPEMFVNEVVRFLKE